MMRFIVFQLFAATRTEVFVSTAIDIPQTDDSFQTPAARQHPVVTISYTHSDHPTFETIAVQFTEVRTEKFEIHVDIAQVINSTEQMRPHKMAVETFARPIA